MVYFNMYKEKDKRSLHDLKSNHLKTIFQRLFGAFQIYCRTLFNQKRVISTKMNLFSVIFFTFILNSESMPTDLRSAFGNMLHHTLFENDGPRKIKGEFNDIKMVYPAPVKS